jgi:hypothetical protein
MTILDDPLSIGKDNAKPVIRLRVAITGGKDDPVF